MELLVNVAQAEYNEDELIDESVHVVAAARAGIRAPFFVRWLYRWRRRNEELRTLQHSGRDLERPGQVPMPSSEQDHVDDDDGGQRHCRTSSLIGEGFVIPHPRRREETLFVVGQHLGSGSFGAAYRCTRRKCALEVEARRQHRMDTANPLTAGELKLSQEEEDVMGGQRRGDGEEDACFAVKCLKNPTPALLRDLALEAMLMLRITRHRHVASLRFVFPLVDTEQFLVFTDLVSGGKSLQAAMDDGSLFSGCTDSAAAAARGLNLSLQLASGLMHVHSKAVIHFDIKSDNACVDDNGVLKIIDFGMSALGEYRVMSLNREESQKKATNTETRRAAAAPLLGLEVVRVDMEFWLFAPCAAIVGIVCWYTVGNNWRFTAVGVLALATRAVWAFGCAQYPVLRSHRDNTPVLHARLKGGTRSHFSPEMAKAFAQLRHGGEPRYLCAAESDLWAWAVVSTRIFRPPQACMNSGPGENFGKILRKHVALDNASKFEGDQPRTMRNWDEAAVITWLEETKIMSSLITAVSRSNNNKGITGAALDTLLSFTGTKHDDKAMFERICAGAKFKVAYFPQLRRMRRAMGGDTVVPLPAGLRQLLHRALDDDKRLRPARMEEVVAELQNIEHRHKSNRDLPSDEGAAGTLSQHQQEDANDRVAHTAERVGALVNTAMALRSSSTHQLSASRGRRKSGHPGATDAAQLGQDAICLLAEALHVQREAEINGVGDDSGGLRQLLAQACFEQYRRSTLAFLCLAFVFPLGGLSDIGFSVWARVWAFDSVGPMAFGQELAWSLWSCGHLTPRSGLCGGGNVVDDDGQCGNDWFCSEGHLGGTCQACTNCIFSTFCTTMEQHRTCNRTAEVLRTTARGFVCKAGFAMTTIGAYGLYLLILPALLISVGIYYDLLPRRRGVRPPCAILFRHSRLVIWTMSVIGALPQLLTNPLPRLSTASEEDERPASCRTGDESWWWRRQKVVHLPHWNSRGGVRARLLGEQMPSWGLKMYWRDLCCMFASVTVVSVVAGISFPPLIFAWEAPEIARRLWRRNPVSMLWMLFIISAVTIYTFVPALLALHGQHFSFWCYGNYESNCVMYPVWYGHWTLNRFAELR